MKTTKQYFNIAVTLLYGLAVYLFWAVPYRAALSYQEQFQLFLFDKAYLTEHLAWPGGLATWLAECLVQFYNNYWVGAAIVAVLLVSVQLLTYALCRSVAPKAGGTVYALSLAPSMLLWCYMSDLNVLASYVVALVLTLALGCGFCRLNPRGRIAYAVVALPLCYWALGTTVYLLGAVMAMRLWCGDGKAGAKSLWTLAVAAGIAAMVIAGRYWVSHSVYQQAIGINYYRMPDIMPLPQPGVMVAVVSVMALARLCAARANSGKGAWRLLAPYATAALLAAACAAGLRLSYEPMLYQLVDYDYMLRTNQWDAIIARSEKEPPTTPLTVSATNLALGMTDRLDHRAFDFFQNTAEGLLPPFRRETNSAIATAEIYYQLGLINTAQRLYFEAMEALPNHTKSTRCVKRLAETNMLRGNYEVARKYLRLLEKTAMYRKWAQRMMALVDNPQNIDLHPFYSLHREKMLNAEFLYSEGEMDKILGQLYLKNPSNRLARQYLLMYPLLQRDPNKFMQYLQVVQEVAPYSSPVTQQGVAFAYMHAGLEIPRGAVDEYTLQQFNDFARTWTTQGKDSPMLERFAHTLWYYMVKR